LEPLHGQKVAVGYDIHDASRVWVREIDFGKEAYRVGRLICVAEWNAHQTRYVPVSVQQKGDEQRVSAALKRLEDKAETKRAELTGPRVVEVQTEEPLLLAPDVAEAVEVMAKALEAPEVVDRPRLTLVRDEPAPSIAAPKPEALADPAARPKLTDDISWARWLMDHPERWEKHDHVGMASLVRDGKFRILAEYNDLDLEALDALVRAKAAEAAVHNQSNDTKGYTHHAG
jgi:putative transposase